MILIRDLSGINLYDILAAEVKVMSIQEHCRISIRRILREHIRTQHPELEKKRRPKKVHKQPSPRRGNRINMVPMNMGMMILGGFGDSDEGMGSK